MMLQHNNFFKRQGSMYFIILLQTCYHNIVVIDPERMCKEVIFENIKQQMFCEMSHPFDQISQGETCTLHLCHTLFNRQQFFQGWFIIYEDDWLRKNYIFSVFLKSPKRHKFFHTLFSIFGQIVFQSPFKLKCCY